MNFQKRHLTAAVPFDITLAPTCKRLEWSKQETSRTTVGGK